MSQSRKDYGTDAIIPQSNEALKRVTNVNAPFSTQALGNDFKNNQLLPENYDSIKEGDMLLRGNIQETVTEVIINGSGLEPVLESIVTEKPFVDIDMRETNEESPIETTYTKAELLADSCIVIKGVLHDSSIPNETPA